MRSHLLLVGLLALVPGRASATCTISVDTRQHLVRINGKSLGDIRVSTLTRVLGRATRVERVKDRVRKERFPRGGGALYSITFDVENYHYIYDDLGLVFQTRNVNRYGASRDPVFLVLLVRAPTGALHSALQRGSPPEGPGESISHTVRAGSRPRKVFSGVLKINGHVVSARRRLVPAGVDYKTEHFRLFDAQFAPTSYGGEIDSIYSHDGPSIQIYLDGVKRQRAAHVTIQP